MTNDPKAVGCPRCGAVPGRPCSSSSGAWSAPHATRRYRAEHRTPRGATVPPQGARVEAREGVTGRASVPPSAGEVIRAVAPSQGLPTLELLEGLRIGSLFSGYGGLERGVSAVTGGTTAWVSDIDKGACKILAARFPEVPNLGDISGIDWSTVEPVDILTGGFPCQDVSSAGAGRGLQRGVTRTGLWGVMCQAIDELRPQLVIAENVRGLLNAKADSQVEPCAWCLGDDSDRHMRALGAVLGDLADIGYDARWVMLPASHVGAPHERARVFILAYPAGSEAGLAGYARHDPRRALHVSEPPAGGDGQGQGPGPRESGRADRGRADSAETVADAGGQRHGRGQDARRVGGVEHRPEYGAPAARPELGDRGSEAAADPDGRDGGEQPDQPEQRRADAGTGGQAAADAGRVRRDERRIAAPGQEAGRGSLSLDGGRAGTPAAAADAQGDEQRQRAARGHDSEPRDGADPAGGSAAEEAGQGQAPIWGEYAYAIERWASVINRPAPHPTVPGKKPGPDGIVRPRTNPKFIEWMMGLPAGWVTDVPDLSIDAQQKALGNGVVPLQAAAAVELLLTAAAWNEVEAS